MDTTSILPRVQQLSSQYPHGYFVWIKTREWDHAVITKERALVVKQDFERRAGLLEQAFESGEWPAKTSALCAYCPVVQDCEDAREKGYHRKAEHIRKNRAQ